MNRNSTIPTVQIYAVNEYLETAVRAVRKAGDIQRELFRESIEIQYKSPSDPVTNVDIRSEEAIIESIEDAYPSHSYIAEEQGSIGTADFQWLIDPLDGTSNYVRGHPDFAVSVALRHIDDIKVGVIYHPISQTVYTAIRDEGVWRDDNPITVSDSQSLETSIISIPYSSSSAKRSTLWRTIEILGKRVEGIRSTGSGALDLAFVASGFIDGAIGFNQATWDRAAGFLMCREASATMTDHVGDSPNEDYVIANDLIHDEFLRIVSNQNR